MEQLFSGSPERHFRKGQILIYEGDPIEFIHYLVSGYVKVSNINASGSQRTIVLYAPGDAFPLTSFLSGRDTAAYFYECMTDVAAKVRPQAEFQNAIKGNLELGEQLIAYTYTINQQFLERIETLSAASARHKIVALLRYLSGKAGSKKDGLICLDIPLTSQEIADMCSLTRETASVQLIRLRAEGVILGRRFVKINPVKLAKLHP